MANCDMQATPSQEELKKTENNKNVKNSEESRPINLKSDVDIDFEPTTSSETELRPSRSSVTKMTKIPAPIYFGPSGSSRLYSTVIHQHKDHTSSENLHVADDSGIHLDSSMTELETPVLARPSQTILDRISVTDSEMELRRAEEQTLKELQRVVAEMEAEVALDGLDSPELQSEVNECEDHSEGQDQNEAIEIGLEYSVLDTETFSANETQQIEVFDDPEQGPTNEELTVDSLHIQDSVNKNESPEVHESSEVEEYVEVEESVGSELFEQLAEESAEENTKIDLPGSSEEFVPMQELQETVPESVIALEESMSIVIQKSVPESSIDELEMAKSGGCETKDDSFLMERKPEILVQKFQARRMKAYPSFWRREWPPKPSLDGSLESERLMVPLEELFDPEHNVQLLRQLMQAAAVENVIVSEQILIESECANENEMKEETETDEEPGDDQENGLAKKQTGKPINFLQRFISRKILKLSYPILFCTLAFGLIYLSRKE
ncbi:LOW QUALITY PROTEIN: uncharacterized protein LOC108107062 [Drosophila eugracilis]|uniref:LOW QUALITY PROTEIN: uncharacterized protein LOC108107062 n=1 Tax=Drosophila eugracilis TaxID=29029 RepID=UPI001BD93DE8|nr:LOW QUALITY PROTEIN: uncharacterized protein LOC108107062 [Drosophila eugracilis]